MPETPRTDPQIKSRQRVRDLAEVYTHEREVNAMLDLVPDMFPSAEDPENIDRTFLEPACGSGNFLVEILRRKLAFVTTDRYGNGERFEHAVIRCLASIYAIDICAENVEESCERLADVVTGHAEAQLGSRAPSAALKDAANAVLATNVICADTLTDSAEIELVEYRPVEGAAFIRTWNKPLGAEPSELNLFSTDPPQDPRPVHYSELARQREPVAADYPQQQAA